jgi:PAS domain S-box-containing protein
VAEGRVISDEAKSREELLGEVAELRRRLDNLGLGQAAALLDRAERARLMAESRGDVFYRLRYDHMIYDYISPAVTSLTGYTWDEVKAGGLKKAILRFELLDRPNVSPEEVVRERQAGLTGEYKARYLIQAKDGRRRWLLDHSFPWLDAQGRLKGSVGILSDVTDRQGQPPAATGESYLRLMLDCLPEAVALLDARSFKILEANAALMASLGLAREEVLGRTCHDLAHRSATPCHGDGLTCPVAETAASGLASRGEHRHARRGGGEALVAVTAWPVFDPSGRVNMVVQVQREIAAPEAVRERE